MKKLWIVSIYPCWYMPMGVYCLHQEEGERNPIMTKLAYINDQQIINDTAQLLIKNHLAWSGSHEKMPSRDNDNVRDQMVYAYLSAHFTTEEWNEMSESEQKLQEEMAHALFKQAAQLADRKWEAAMTLLGIEQQ